MDAFIKFLQAFFSYVIIIPLSLFCLLPLKNQLKYPISKIVTLFLCSFIILGSLSSIVMTAFDIQNLNFVLFPDLVIFFFLIKSVTKAGTARCLFVFISVCCLISFFSLYSYYSTFSARLLLKKQSLQNETTFLKFRKVTQNRCSRT